MNKTIIRLNQRDNRDVTLASDPTGIPQCPHCAAPMSRSGDCYENSGCDCWWVGAADGIYPKQVVVALTSEDDARVRAAASQQAGERASEDSARDTEVAALGAALVADGWTPRATLKEKWAGHWSKGSQVVIAHRTPIYGGYTPDYSLSQKGGPLIAGPTSDPSQILAALGITAA